MEIITETHPIMRFRVNMAAIGRVVLIAPIAHINTSPILHSIMAIIQRNWAYLKYLYRSSQLVARHMESLETIGHG
jgi:hypothetical protein